MSRIDTFSVYVALDKLRIRPNTWLSGLLSCNSSHDRDQSAAQSLTHRQPFVYLLFKTSGGFFVSSLSDGNLLSRLFFSGKQEMVRTTHPTLSHTQQPKHAPQHECLWHEFVTDLTVLSNCLCGCLANQFCQCEPDQVVLSISIKRRFPLRWMLKRNHTSISTFFKLHKCHF